MQEIKDLSREEAAETIEYIIQLALPVKNLCAKAGHKRHEFDPRVWKIPWRRAWQLIPLFLPGESLGQRSLAGYSPWGHRESDMTEVT